MKTTQNTLITHTLFYLSLIPMLAACDKKGASFSLLSETAAFKQDLVYTPRKIDILWIVDNSGSMESSQTALTQNFQRFIDRFKDLKFDFHMAVQTSDAWKGRYEGAALKRLKDGTDATSHSGVFVMDKNTGGLNNVFLTNATQGIDGSADERAFVSFEDTLTYAGNSDFRRSDAFLAIIIVSDEDDFSATDSTYLNNNYNHAKLVPVSYYKNFLDTTAGAGNYSVNAITIMDSACLADLNNSFTGRRIGQRYLQLADLSNGKKASLCSDFGVSLELIRDSILQLSSTFVLDREPNVSSIHITVDGVVMPQDATNGWSYNPANMTLSFNGTAVPPANSNVVIEYDPLRAKN